MVITECGARSHLAATKKHPKPSSAWGSRSREAGLQAKTVTRSILWVLALGGTWPNQRGTQTQRTDGTVPFKPRNYPEYPTIACRSQQFRRSAGFLHTSSAVAAGRGHRIGPRRLFSTPLGPGTVPHPTKAGGTWRRLQGRPRGSWRPIPAAPSAPPVGVGGTVHPVGAT